MILRDVGYVTYTLDTRFLDPENIRTLIEPQILYLQYVEATLCSIFLANYVHIPPERITQAQSLTRIRERLREDERSCAQTFRLPHTDAYPSHLRFTNSLYKEVNTYLQYHDDVPILNDKHRRDKRGITYDVKAVLQMARLLCGAFVKFKYPVSATGKTSTLCYAAHSEEDSRTICIIRAKQPYNEGDSMPSISGIFVPLTEKELKCATIDINDFTLLEESELSRCPSMLLGPCRLIRRACDSYNIEFDKATNDTVSARVCRAIAKDDEILVRYAPGAPQTCTCTDHLLKRMREPHSDYDSSQYQPMNIFQEETSSIDLIDHNEPDQQYDFSPVNMNLSTRLKTVGSPISPTLLDSARQSDPTTGYYAESQVICANSVSDLLSNDSQRQGSQIRSKKSAEGNQRRSSLLDRRSNTITRDRHASAI